MINIDKIWGIWNVEKRGNSVISDKGSLVDRNWDNF
jgi:hypothetical protein